jgi:hypothetical protein
MSWLLVVLAGWAVVAAVLAVAIGAAIRVADRRAARVAAARAAVSAPNPADVVTVPPPGAPDVPPADGLGAGTVPMGEPIRPRTPDMDSGPAPARRVDEARPVIVRQRQAH